MNVVLLPRYKFSYRLTCETFNVSASSLRASFSVNAHYFLLQSHHSILLWRAEVAGSKARATSNCPSSDSSPTPFSDNNIQIIKISRWTIVKRQERTPEWSQPSANFKDAEREKAFNEFNKIYGLFDIIKEHEKHLNFKAIIMERPAIKKVLFRLCRRKFQEKEKRKFSNNSYYSEFHNENVVSYDKRVSRASTD